MQPMFGDLLTPQEKIIILDRSEGDGTVSGLYTTYPGFLTAIEDAKRLRQEAATIKGLESIPLKSILDVPEIKKAIRANLINLGHIETALPIVPERLGKCLVFPVARTTSPLNEKLTTQDTLAFYDFRDSLADLEVQRQPLVFAVGSRRENYFYTRLY